MEVRKQLRNYPWVDVPCHHDVKDLLSMQKASHSYFKRGNGDATKELGEVEALHRQWVKKMINLQDFPYCYFVNGATD